MLSSPENPNTGKQLHWIHLGHRDYRETLALQLQQWALRVEGRVPDTIFSVEHNPVITLGKRANISDVLIGEDALRARHIDLVSIDRGGEATWHGPGQLVLYPIVHIGELNIGPSDLVRGLADAIVTYLHTLDLHPQWQSEHPGLWINDKKIAAVGMRIQQSVSRHGAALNLHTAQDAFSVIVPCGLPQFGVTSVLEQSNQVVSLLDAADGITQAFAQHFGFIRSREPLSR